MSKFMLMELRTGSVFARSADLSAVSRTGDTVAIFVKGAAAPFSITFTHLETARKVEVMIREVMAEGSADVFVLKEDE